MSNEDIGRTAAERFRAEHSLGTNPISDLVRPIDLPRYNPKSRNDGIFSGMPKPCAASSPGGTCNTGW